MLEKSVDDICRSPEKKKPSLPERCTSALLSIESFRSKFSRRAEKICSEAFTSLGSGTKIYIDPIKTKDGQDVEISFDNFILVHSNIGQKKLGLDELRLFKRNEDDSRTFLLAGHHAREIQQALIEQAAWESKSILWEVKAYLYGVFNDLIKEGHDTMSRHQYVQGLQDAAQSAPTAMQKLGSNTEPLKEFRFLVRDESGKFTPTSTIPFQSGAIPNISFIPSTNTCRLEMDSIGIETSCQGDLKKFLFGAGFSKYQVPGYVVINIGQIRANSASVTVLSDQYDPTDLIQCFKLVPIIPEMKIYLALQRLYRIFNPKELLSLE